MECDTDCEMRDKMKSLIVLISVTFFVVACGGSPSAPTPQTASLHIGIDISTCYSVLDAAISIDGTEMGIVFPGDAGITKQVSIGAHYVSGIGLVTNGSHETWGPFTVNVPTGGFNELFYCTGSHGFLYPVK